MVHCRPAAAWVLALLALVLTVVACAPSERQLRSRELKDRLVAEGYPVTSLTVWEPRGTVPHWVAEAEVSTGEADATAACRAIAAVRYDRDPIYLVEVSYPGGMVQCGFSREASPAPDP